MAGVYLSYPFCSQKCTYCNFASGVFPKDLEASYLSALLRELRASPWEWTPATVYLGGGTPSLIDTTALREILGAIPGRWLEATMEAAPGGLTAEQVAAWRDAGIDRVSFGTQSFVPAELARTGRKHTPEVVAREVGLLRGQGIENFNLDLIAGLPGQTLDSWQVSLDWIEKLAAPHVSVYMLEVDEDSRLGAELIAFGQRYGARDVPEDDAIAEMYEIAVDRLRRAGLERYEISNFARPGFASKHNLKYWRREPYFGFGADAHSFDGRERWQNVETAAEYVARDAARESVVAERTTADPQGERFFLGLRLNEGIAPPFTPYEDVIRRFEGEGLLEHHGDSVRLTSRGVLLSNEIFAEFV